MQPHLRSLEIIRTSGVKNLKETIEAILGRERIDAVVHSMAVSDYAPQTVTTVAAAAQSAARQLSVDQNGKLGEADIRAALEQALREEGRFSGNGKIPSNVDGLLLTFSRTPKIIAVFKELQPETLLFGFKLLSGVTRDALLAAGLGILRENRCDYVLATDSESLRDGGQTGFLLAPDGSWQKFDGKPAIARRIARLMWEKYPQRSR